VRVSKLIKELQKYPMDANARAYEGEVCGIIVENHVDWDDDYEMLGVIDAHESEDD